SPVENPLFKCGRCHNLFRQFPGATPPSESSPPSRRAAAAPEPDTLEFIFPERQPAELLVPETPPAPPAPARAAAPMPRPVIIRTPLEQEVPVAAASNAVSEVTAVVERDEQHELGLDDDMPIDD